MNCPHCHYDVVERLSATCLTADETRVVELSDRYRFANKWLEGLKLAAVAIYGAAGGALSGVHRCTSCNHIWREWQAGRKLA